MLLAALLGVLVGVIMALTGAGGAIIAVPLLMAAFHWTVPEATPAALLAVGSAAAVGALIGLRAGIVRYRAALLMAGIGSLMAPLGLLLAHRLPTAPLALLFAAVLLYVAQRLFRQAQRELRGLPDPDAQPDSAACKLSSETGRFEWDALCTRALLQAGVLAGFLSGLLGVGGGFVIVPALRRATDLAMHSVVATSLMVIALVSTTGVASSLIAGRLNLAIAIPFTLGAVLAMLAARPFARRLAGPRLQQGFALMSGLVAVALVIRTLT